MKIRTNRHGERPQMVEFPVTNSSTVAIGDAVTLTTSGRVNRCADNAPVQTGGTGLASAQTGGIIGIVTAIRTSTGGATSATGDSGGTVYAQVTLWVRNMLIEVDYSTGTPAVGDIVALIGATSKVVTSPTSVGKGIGLVTKVLDSDTVLMLAF